jgi:hypothetical protein
LYGLRPVAWTSNWWEHFDLFDCRYHKEKANAKIACCKYCKAEIKLSERFLAIPATSAPSERLWSISAKILHKERAKLDSKIVSDMMFLHEDHAILCKHYEAITGVPLTEAILPGIYDMDIDEEINVG